MSRSGSAEQDNIADMQMRYVLALSIIMYVCAAHLYMYTDFVESLT
jgi:hypothetical protein